MKIMLGRKSIALVASMALSESVYCVGATTAGLTVSSHWVGPGDYNRVEVVENVASLVGGGCTKETWFAIKTSDPNYNALSSLVLTALTTGKKINVYGPGTECINNGEYAVVNRVTIYK
jgi:hypothetical protein